jgi:Xaa-Pro aminopeptidase
MLRLQSASAGAIDAIMVAARPGVPATDVARAGMEYIKPIEKEVAFHYYFGYPIGLGYPATWIEQLGFFIRLENPRPLHEGMVFHLPMSLRKYGEYGVNLSQSMLVTPEGGVPLSRLPARLEVLA